MGMFWRVVPESQFKVAAMRKVKRVRTRVAWIIMAYWTVEKCGYSVSGMESSVSKKVLQAARQLVRCVWVDGMESFEGRLGWEG
jgi:hypothetical protein